MFRETSHVSTATKQVSDKARVTQDIGQQDGLSAQVADGLVPTE